MPEAFQYCALQVVPRVERGERINAGVVLFCRRHGQFLQARIGLDPARLRALDPEADVDGIRGHLDALAAVAAGEGDSPVAAMEPSERFHWLAAPSSTIIQATPVHTGLTENPFVTLERLFVSLVA